MQGSGRCEGGGGGGQRGQRDRTGTFFREGGREAVHSVSMRTITLSDPPTQSMHKPLRLSYIIIV